ncbi:MAG: ferritin-like domain-containing protein [Desulfosporosinus sp.]|nr:ferritin-like domain-containing protein [Desulfosporosinus sp.]
MDDKQLITELNKILTLEHGHLGMYENYGTYQDKDMRRTFRRFTELEMEHINKIQSIIRNLGEKPSLIVEGGDILGKLFGVSMHVTGDREVLKVYNFIEQKSHQGYSDFISKLEREDNKMYQFVAEITAANKLEAYLQHLWLKDKLDKI